ncbi:DUF4335 domain-containing protein [Halomicronema sp. CCY15110]|uniref:DUF4335 domain-containing protein n=1 Tax=Halomicronema sp. CCY15110 TaxID=2767773 RepID=UPI00194F1643|nr:DUF4335 domain-containing protein [Halomicronema sp. CCY15110]
MTSTTQLTPLRYDAPTVTLEVMTRAAAVSQWSDKPVVQVLRYQLQIRDLSGELTPIEIRGDRASFLPFMQAIEAYVQAQLGGDRDRPAPSPAPYLEAQGLTQHTLHLGRDRTTAGQSQVTLGAIQLADLEQVFDDLNQAVRPLPISLVAARQRLPWQQWGAAAAGLVAAVGVTTVLWPSYQSQQGMETAQPVPSADQETALSPDLSPKDRTSPKDDPTDAPASDSADGTDESPAAAESAAIAPVNPRIEPETNDNSAASAPATDPPPRPSAPTPGPTPPAEEGAAPLSENAPPKRATESQPPTATAPPAPATADAMPAQPPANSEAAGNLTEETAEPFSHAAPQRAANTSAPGSLAALVQQIRDRWNPPSDLTQTLTYTLVFAADGTLVEVIPNDAVAAEYRDRTGIPPVGTVGLPSGDPQRVRLLLQPNGEVEFQSANFN